MSNPYRNYIIALWDNNIINELEQVDTMFQQKLIAETSFLEDPSLRQRLWHIVNNIYRPVLCPMCSNHTMWNSKKHEYYTYCPGNCNNIINEIQKSIR